MIALIAGEGSMPSRVIEGIHAAGQKVLLLAIEGCTEKELEKSADQTVWLHVTQLGKAIKTCLGYQVKEVVMAGRIHHKEIFKISLFRLDWKAFRLWLSLKDRRADTLLRGIADVFQKSGITLLSVLPFLKKYVAKEGKLTHKAPSPALWKEIEFGSEIAKEIGRLDIGQTVVVKNLSVVAVEAMEGTDQCIERAASLAGEGIVVVKMAKPSQDERFDLPVIGKNTIEKLIKCKAAALAVQREKTLILDPEVISFANNAGFIIVSV